MSLHSFSQKFLPVFTGAFLLTTRDGCWACAEALAVVVDADAVVVGVGVGVVVGVGVGVVVGVGVGVDVVVALDEGVVLDDVELSADGLALEPEPDAVVSVLDGVRV